MLQQNIANAIKTMKKDGITGCSMDCLFQNTSFRGLQMTLSELRDSFAALAREEAKKKRFKLTGELT